MATFIWWHVHFHMVTCTFSHGDMHIFTWWHAHFHMVTCRFSHCDMHIFTWWHAHFHMVTCMFSHGDMQIFTLWHAHFHMVTCTFFSRLTQFLVTFQSCRENKTTRYTFSNSFWKSYRIWVNVARNSADGIATRYKLDGPGIDSQWGRDLPHQSRRALAPLPNLLYTG
jgi:hypothetical protein